MSKSKRRKFPPAVAMGKRGGKARARVLSAKERSAIARKGARVRESRRAAEAVMI